MDISAQSWKRGVSYSKNDIVKIDNLTNIDDFYVPPQDPIKTDGSTWKSVMNEAPGEGWGAWQPNELKYTNLSQKTSNPEDYMLFYHSTESSKYTSILEIDNEYEWLKQEINSSNYNNLLLEYINSDGEVLVDASNQLLSYTGTDLTHQYFEPDGGFYPDPQRLGVKASQPFNPYVSTQFDQPYDDIRARITQISSGQTITSTRLVVYSEDDDVFGRGIITSISAKGGTVPDMSIDTESEERELSYGGYFPVNPRWDYSTKAMIKKATKDSELIDNYKTFLTETNGAVDPINSIGVGVAIQFYDENFNKLNPSDRRNTYRLLAQAELSHDEYYTAYLDIRSKDIPEGARLGQVFVFIYGLKSGGFEFDRISATSTSPFFYCAQDHDSSIQNHPGSELWHDTGYWTQDFEWRPSYGSKSNFVATNENLDLGEGSDYVNNLAINSLPLEIDVSFNNRTDKEAKAIMHFLQEKHFAYESIFGIDYRGDRLLSGDVSSFRFVYTHPYRKDLHFTCTDFSHSILYRNNNVVSAKFVCNTESSLKSVDSHAGYNYRLDVLVPVFIDAETKFTKGEQLKLNTFSLESGDEEDPTETLDGASDIIKVSDTEAQIIFNQDQSIELGDCVYIEIPEEDSIFSVGLTKIVHKIDDRNYIFGPILESGSDASPQTINIKHLERCPEDCLTSKVLFPPGLDIIPPETLDPVTGVPKKRVVMLKNYRKIQIDSEITKDSKEIIVTPLSDFTLNATDDFYILVPAVRGRHSIYLENPDRIPKFPWLEVRSFEQKPSLSFELNNSPDTVQSSFVKYYNKKYKKQINQNLSKFTVVFDQRDDEEALEILQFLESHLGCKKFRFSMPRPYLTDESHETTLSKPRMSIFFCPSWDHEVSYKNNHKITATFIESATSKEEDLFSVFGIGQNESRPCYSAYLEDPITPHQLCTFSSVLQTATCGGFKRLQGGEVGVQLKRKAVDIIFIVDTTGSMTYYNISGSGPSGNFNISKFNASIDAIRKMIVAHDDYVMPGTNSYGGQINAPSIKFTDISGDDNLPPWAVNEDGNSLIDAAVDDINKDLKSKGFNVDNFERFKIKIDKQRVNIGLMVMGVGPKNRTIIDSSSKDGFDKVNAYKKAGNIPISFGQFYEGEYFAKYIAKGLAQMYNSPRAEYVTDRIMIMLSDGVIAGDASFDNDTSGKIPHTWSPKALEMCRAMRADRELAKRRPRDEVLDKYGHISRYGGTIKGFLDEFKWTESDEGKSLYHNPDNGVDNPDWYEERLNTIFMSVGIGVPGKMSNKLPQYVYDYEEETKGKEFYFEISSAGNQGGELKRLLNLIKAVEVISEGSGYENYFSVTVHNCGPRDVEIKNTLINIESEAEPLKWTTERLKGGIPKSGSFQKLEYLNSEEIEGNSSNGNGGQYYGDPNNKRALTDETTADSNILWKSFNTKYEIYRDCGLVLIDGGWKNKPSSGVNNVGVASKGMPVRVFTGSTDLQVVDYNIGNVTEENNFQGDYSHLPKLKTGQSLDLFFGIRVNRLANINEKIQLVFNTDDGSIKKSDCYGEIQFPIKLDDVTEPEPVELEPEPPKLYCDGISEYLPIDEDGRIHAVQVFTVGWSSGSFPQGKNWVGGPDGSGCSLEQIPDSRGTFGAGIPFGIDDARGDQSAHPPGINYKYPGYGNVSVKSSYVILKDDDVHEVPSPYSQKLGNNTIGIPSVTSFMDGLGGFGLVHRVGSGVDFGTMIVPPGWRVDVYNHTNYGCVNQFSGIKGPFIFYNPRANLSPSPGAVPSSIKQLYGEMDCPIWDAMANIKSIPVYGLGNSNCYSDAISTGSLYAWQYYGGAYANGRDGRENAGGYSFKLTKIPIDDRSGSYTQRGPKRFQSRSASN